MSGSHIHWSESTESDLTYKQRVDELYRKGVELLKGRTLYGYQINLNNPKEVIACLYILAEDFNSFHER